MCKLKFVFALVILILPLTACDKKHHPLDGKWENSTSGLALDINVSKNRVEYINAPGSWITFKIKSYKIETVEQKGQFIPLTIFTMGLQDIVAEPPENMNGAEIKKFQEEIKKSAKGYMGQQCIMRVYNTQEGIIYAQITHPLNKDRGYSPWLEFDLIGDAS